MNKDMFNNCSSLTSILLFNTSKAKWVPYMFYNCLNVNTGASSLYYQMKNQTEPPTLHDYTFRNCGINTVQGQAELAKIPSDWK